MYFFLENAFAKSQVKSSQVKLVLSTHDKADDTKYKMALPFFGFLSG